MTSTAVMDAPPLPYGLAGMQEYDRLSPLPEGWTLDPVEQIAVLPGGKAAIDELDTNVTGCSTTFGTRTDTHGDD